MLLGWVDNECALINKVTRLVEKDRKRTVVEYVNQDGQ